ncbi:Pentatricopeptide repeat-containing protein [Apostasia shenzhenica]|uniref:Pentatricopeptide repeat-containing protein n=1 Tax=Apostasia shenzhenica TaxID=1088818 RepID=A0A2I0AJU7_9ASPA|nr:Pentatricopeptide repeat-containing protein [Apostasia shenzhenica]
MDLLLHPIPRTPTTLSAEDLLARRRAVLQGLASCFSMSEIRQYHSQLIRLGLSSDNDAAGRLLRFCAISPAGDLLYALRLFQRLPNPDPFIFNTLFHSPFLSSPLLIYTQMLLRSVHPNQFTFPSLFKSLSSVCDPRSLSAGRQVHAHVFKLGFHSDSFSQNNLISFYFSCVIPADARQVFDKMPHRSVIAWTTMVGGLCDLGFVEEARNLFDEMPERNSVTWNAMISGYVRNGSYLQALRLFDLMREEGFELEKFTAASLLAACAGLCALEQGRWIHRYIERNGIEVDTKLATTIIDMYCKCGCLEKAYDVFNSLPTKGISSWNSMIGGLATHGRGEEAIKLFGEMEKEMVPPDDITLTNLLSACAHVGFVDQGRKLFDRMVLAHGINPKMEHFGCLVDLYGRAGRLREAEKVIDEMPMEPDASVLGALLGACRIHGNVDLGERIGKRVVELDPKNSGRYVLLANLYAIAGRLEDAANARRLMDDRGVKKETGRSMIEKDCVINEFVAGDKAHPEAREIYDMVDEMLQRIRRHGYVPDTGGGLQDIDEEENPLCYHCEKLAIAFGLMKTKQGETMRICKNLRVCRDCHEASKLISLTYEREIIVRDRNRFHHFKGGQCSCNDYCDHVRFDLPSITMTTSDIFKIKNKSLHRVHISTPNSSKSEHGSLQVQYDAAVKIMLIKNPKF